MKIGRPIKIEQLVDRIVATDSQVLIATYERQIKQLEEKRVITDEKIRNCGTVDHTLGNINRTFLNYLQNPHEFWISSEYGCKKTVLKATFAKPLAYSKTEGYRTPALALPFSVLRDFDTLKSGLVVGSGFDANCSDKFIEAIQRSSKLFDSVTANTKALCF